MDIFGVLSLFGGLALFLYGMDTMGKGLERKAGGKLKGILEKLTASPAKGLLLGLGVTAVIQSSSATTVMVVGFVNSGIMKLEQAIGVIMGANIGTTVTAWILSLTGLQGDSFFVTLLKPSSFTPVLAVVGIIFYMFVQNNKKKDTGAILLGFAILMFGMEAMSAAVAPLAYVPEFTNLLLLFSNPLFGVLAGAILTAIIQSSSASVGILQALSSTGQITFGSAIPIIMGQNIGTCVTAMISSIGANKNAKRAAVVHLCFNIIGTILFLVLFYSLQMFFDFAFVSSTVNQVGIAIVHTIFNILSTLVMLPFAKQLERLAFAIVKDKDEEDSFQLLDERLLATPSVAVKQCRTVSNEMAVIARNTLAGAMKLSIKYDEATARALEEAEDKIDMYEDKLGTYMIKVSEGGLVERDNREISTLLHCIGDFERIGDHAMNLIEIAKEIDEKKIEFSEEGRKEISTMYDAVKEVVMLAMDAFLNDDVNLAIQVEPLEEVIDLLQTQLKSRHVERLQSGHCTIELGFVFSDLITNYERIADHCSNIAVCLIQSRQNLFDTHAYINHVKTAGDQEYLRLYDQYKEKYAV